MVRDSENYRYIKVCSLFCTLPAITPGKKLHHHDLPPMFVPKLAGLAFHAQIKIVWNLPIRVVTNHVY